MDYNMSDALKEALFTGMYYCSKCGSLMQFEDEHEETLVCLNCGHDVDLEMYGMEDEQAYDILYPTKEDVCGYDEEEDDEFEGYGDE